MFIAVLLIAVMSLFGQTFGWQAASFDLDDPEAARAKYEEISAIESMEDQGQAWCSLTDQELRAIAKHTEMSNTITTTTHTSSTGETTASTVIEPAPNQDELVEWAVRLTADSCRYNAWANAERLQAAADEKERAEVLCRLGPEEAEMLILFLATMSVSTTGGVTNDNGESTMTTVSGPSEPVEESGLAAILEALSAECGWDTP